jgi:hypothetical protein
LFDKKSVTMKNVSFTSLLAFLGSLMACSPQKIPDMPTTSAVAVLSDTISTPSDSTLYEIKREVTNEKQKKAK